MSKPWIFVLIIGGGIAMHLGLLTIGATMIAWGVYEIRDRDGK